MNSPTKQPTEKKRVSLPVVGAKKTLLEHAELGNDVSETRSPIAWVGLGVMAHFVFMIPLALVGTVPFRSYTQGLRPMNGQVVVGIAIMGVVVLAIASSMSGYLIGRFGRSNAGVREGTLSGFVAGCILWVLSWWGVHNKAGIFAGFTIVILTSLCAWLGARKGKRSRRFEI